MNKNTVEQQAKLARLVKLGLIENTRINLVQRPRLAIAIALVHKCLERWEDFGGYYILTFPNQKPVRVRVSAVGETVVDKILSIKDPTDSTADKELLEKAAEEVAKEEPVVEKVVVKKVVKAKPVAPNYKAPEPKKPRE